MGDAHHSDNGPYLRRRECHYKCAFAVCGDGASATEGLNQYRRAHVRAGQYARLIRSLSLWTSNHILIKAPYLPGAPLLALFEKWAAAQPTAIDFHSSPLDSALHHRELAHPPIRHKC